MTTKKPAVGMREKRNIVIYYFSLANKKEVLNYVDNQYLLGLTTPMVNKKANIYSGAI